MKHHIQKLLIVFITFLLSQAAPANDSLVLSLTQTIELAQQQSPTVQSARHAFLAAYWNYRQYRANYLPSLTLISSPNLNRSINKITQADGTSVFLKQNQLSTDLTLKVNQKISLTGGSLFAKSTLTRLDELEIQHTSFSSQPLLIGYEQSLFGFNSLRWERRIEPVRYRKARQTYAETLELVSAKACDHFFRLMAAQTNLDMARLNLASADTLYNMAKGRYSIGNINENEMLQLEINRLNEETNFMDAEIYMEEEMQSFRSFLGLEQDIVPRLTAPDSVPMFTVPVTEALDMAVEHSPDPTYYQLIKLESKSNLAYAKANTGLKADIYMHFGLSQTGQTMRDSYRNPLNQEYVSLSLSLPILDWGRGRGQVRVARSNLALTETQAEQGMRDFRQNVQKIVMQFNMQGRKVNIAAKTDRQAEHRYEVARRLYVLGRSTILDLNSAISEKDNARRNYINAQSTYWTLYYTIRSMTGYDFLNGREIAADIKQP